MPAGLVFAEPAGVGVAGYIRGRKRLQKLVANLPAEPLLPPVGLSSALEDERL